LPRRPLVARTDNIAVIASEAKQSRFAPARVAEIASSRCALLAMTTSTVKFLLVGRADHTG